MTSCARCSRPATVQMRFDYAMAEIWLDDFHGRVGPGGYAMCDPHADRVTPPIGWGITDRRDPVRPLFLALDPS